MRSVSKSDDGKSKDNQAEIISTVGEIRRTTEANQQRLQNLELAVANLTSICNALRKDMCSLGLSKNGSFRKVQAKATDKKPPFSRSSSQSSLELKDDKMMGLGVQMQQLVQQAAALGILKDTNVSGNMKANPKAPTRPAIKNVQATKNQRGSTRSPVRNMKATTEKKLSMKLTSAKNIMGATLPKAPPKKAVNGMNATTAAKVSFKSTVTKTEKTVSKVYVGSAPERSNGTSVASVAVKSSVKNVETAKGKGSMKLTVKAYDNSHIALQSNMPTVTSPLSRSPSAAKLTIKPRRRWSTTKDVTVKN